MRTIKHILMVLIILTVIVFSCKDRDTSTNDPNLDGEPYGIIVDTSGCKEFPPDTTRKRTKNEECVQANYSAQDKILTLVHVNAGFNCCPGVISADISIGDGVVTIVEKQSEAGCRCNCLYDVEYELRNIRSGEYQFIVTGPLTGNESFPPLEGAIDLSEGSGEFCVTRNLYPWE